VTARRGPATDGGDGTLRPMRSPTRSAARSPAWTWRRGWGLGLVVWAIACGGGRDPSDLPPAGRIGSGGGSAGGTAPRPNELSPADEQARFDRDRRPDVIVAAAQLGPGSVVADVGAGTGLLTVHLARAVRPGGRVVATDIDAAVLDLMAPRLDAAGVADVVERRVVSADDPGLEPATFDVILLAEVDHYFSDRTTWLRTATAALRPGGRFILTNRIHHRAAALAALAAVGLSVRSEATPVPSHFVVVATRR
jgi:precorrin-6B methylase 2